MLNIAFLALAAVLVWRFFATGGMEMLRMMGGAPSDLMRMTGLPDSTKDNLDFVPGLRLD